MDQFKKVIEAVTVIIIVWVGGLFLGNFLNPDHADGSVEQVRAFRLLPEKSVDVLVFGSSHAWKGFNPMVVYEKYGIGVYNYAGNWQRINTSLMYMEDSLRTQHPKVILLETFMANGVLKDVDLNGEIYYSKAVPMFYGKWKYLNQCFGNDLGRWVSYYYPLAMFHSNWNSIGYENFRTYKTAEERLKWMGFSASNTVKKCTVLNATTFEQKDLSVEAITILDEIVDLCSRNDIELVLYTAPYCKEYHYHNALSKYAERKNIPHIDCFDVIDEIGINGDEDFQDEGHLNTNGATKVADYLGKYLSENYILPDVRNNKMNMWEQEREVF